MFKKPPLTLATTTLWEYPSQHYGDSIQGDQSFAGATPSWVIWNLLTRYTREGDLVLDPMAGGGTTPDVCADLKRRCRAYDLAPTRPEIGKADARKLPLDSGTVDFAFVDPPYSTHLEYSDDPACIGKLDAGGPEYYAAMDAVFAEMHRVLKNRRFAAVYVSDSFKKGKPFCPIGFELFGRLCRRFKPADIVAVARHNKKLKRGHWHKAAVEGNFYLRGFNYLLLVKKEE